MKFISSLHPRGARGRFVKKGSSSKSKTVRKAKTKRKESVSDKKRRRAANVLTGVHLGAGALAARPGVNFVKVGVKSGNPALTVLGGAHIAAVGARTANEIHNVRKLHGKRQVRGAALVKHNAGYEKRRKVIRRTVNATTSGLIVGNFFLTPEGGAIGRALKAGVQRKAHANRVKRAAAYNAAKRATSRTLGANPLKTAKRGRGGAYKITTAGTKVRR